ncbi:MAG: DUF1553 domain-containing protein [Planctomyces sp.]
MNPDFLKQVFSRSACLLTAVHLLLLVSSCPRILFGAENSPELQKPASELQPASPESQPVRIAPLTPAETAAQIDRILAESWSQSQVQPAEVADDFEFLRRLFLDLAGRIPSVSEIRNFSEMPVESRRSDITERLLDSAAYVRHFTTVWRNGLIPQAESQREYRTLIPGFQAWLWNHIAQNTPYDVMVRDIIESPLMRDRTSNTLLSSGSSPEAFFLVRDLKPEELATGTARAFLGVRLDCAQCHHHPFDHWKREQFWSFAAFYSRISPDEASANRDAVNVSSLLNSGEEHVIQIPGTETSVPATYLNGQKPEWKQGDLPRTVLAHWVTAPTNPYFSKMAANRLWAQFFGQGIVHPADDFSDNNPPSHPEVLKLLADQLVAHDFDLQFLIRTITATRAYQLTSRMSHESQSDVSQFSRSALRGLTPEQLFDSLAEAVGYYQPYRTENPFLQEDNSPRSRFLELYRDDTESPLQHQTTILQALAMMNGEFVDNATSLESSRTLRAVVEFPLMSDAERIDTLFLSTLSRLPSEEERKELELLMVKISDRKEIGNSLGDVFWVLLNTSEFLLNH